MFLWYFLGSVFYVFYKWLMLVWCEKKMGFVVEFLNVFIFFVLVYMWIGLWGCFLMFFIFILLLLLNWYGVLVMIKGVIDIDIVCVYISWVFCFWIVDLFCGNGYVVKFWNFIICGFLL